MELKEIEEAVLKVVEVRPDAKYVVVLSNTLPDEVGRAVSKYFYREVKVNAIILCLHDPNDIKIFEVER